MSSRNDADTESTRSLLELGEPVLSALERYRETSRKGQGKVLQQPDAKVLAEDLQLEKWIRHGGLHAESLQSFLEPYLAASQHMHHPGYIGHQVAVPHTGSAISELIHGAINNPMAVYEMGPPAAVIEKVVINWMLEKVGWFQGSSLSDFTASVGTGAGVLTHGGSLANLTAILAARAATIPDAWQKGTPDNLALIAPAASHYSMARAVSIAGLGQDAICPAPVSKLEVLEPEKLGVVWQQANDCGRRVFLVSANACTTATGLYDPIDEVADFCAQHDLWLHVDGAHGASALVSETERGLLKGVSRADSLTWDAHKMLRTSALCAAILFKNPESLTHAFAQEGSYIFYDDDLPGFDIGQHTVECTKAALGTKLFWVLAMDGEAGLARFVEQQHAKTREFHDLIAAEPDFACPYVPQSNILCFSYMPLADNDQQMALRTEITRRGNFYVTTAEVGGVRYLRLSVMNPLTSTDTIRELLDEVRTCAKLVKG
jgi:L-2,4-diaminobutyrate decarboxylase